MKKVYFNLTLVALCLVTLTSCNRKFNFVTKGLPETDSSYLVTTDGKHINASIIEVSRSGKLTVDGQERSLDDLSAIKSKKMYFGVKEGDVYAGEVYGKICLLYKMEMGTSYVGSAANTPGYGTGYTPGYGTGYGGAPGMSGYQRTVKKVEYLQKRGSTDIDRFNAGTLVDYVSDNEAALSKAKGGRTWQIASYVPAAGFAGGVIWTFVDLLKGSKTDDVTPNLGPPLLLAGVSLPVYIVTGSVANHKLHKAIKIYNSTPNDAAQ
jgi:hypothetical protein